MSDPLAERLQAAARAGGTDPRPVMAIEPIFGRDLGQSPELAREVEAVLQGFQHRGVRATLEP